MFSFFRRGKKSGHKELDFIRQLSTTPVKNEKAREIESDDGGLAVAVDLKYTGISALLANVLKLRTQKKYQLYGLGLEIYEMVDGKRTVENLVDFLIERYKLTFFEARSLMIQYLSMLMKRGLIVVAIKG